MTYNFLAPIAQDNVSITWAMPAKIFALVFDTDIPMAPHVEQAVGVLKGMSKLKSRTGKELVLPKMLYVSKPFTPKGEMVHISELQTEYALHWCYATKAYYEFALNQAHLKGRLDEILMVAWVDTGPTLEYHFFSAKVGVRSYDQP